MLRTRLEGARSDLAAVGLLTVLAVVVLGMFDAVLLRPEPVFAVAVVLGTATAVGDKVGISRRRSLSWLASASMALMLTITAARLAALTLRVDGRFGNLRIASRLDPGDFTLTAELARLSKQRRDCASYFNFREQSLGVYPHNELVKSWGAQCP